MTLYDAYIVPGGMARASLAKAIGSTGPILVADYALSYGPLLRWRSISEWQHCRDQYWRNLHQGRESLSGSTSDDHLIDNLDLVRSANSIVLWIGTGPNEQLLLVWMIQFLRTANIDPGRLRVIQFDREPQGGFEIVGLGELNPDQLRAHPSACLLTTQQLAEIDRTWAAVTAPDPGELLALLDERNEALPLLRRSLQAMVFRFPSVSTGLNRWEEELLLYTKEEGPAASRVIAYTMVHEFDPPDSAGDTYLFSRMRRLAAPPHPLLSLTGSIASHRDCQVMLTDAGAKVLAGTGNFVAINGTDDWIGGVHLDSTKGNVWFRHGNKIVQP